MYLFKLNQTHRACLEKLKRDKYKYAQYRVAATFLTTLVFSWQTFITRQHPFIVSSVLPLLRHEQCDFALSAAGQVAFKHREQRLLGVPLVPSSCHRPQDRRRRNAEKGGQVQTGRTLPRPLLPSQEERDGEVFPLTAVVQCNV